MPTWDITAPSGSGVGGTGSNTSAITPPGDFDGATINSVTLIGTPTITGNESSNDDFWIRWYIANTAGTDIYGGDGADADSIVYHNQGDFSTTPANLSTGSAPSPAPTTAVAADWDDLKWNYTYTVSGKDDASTVSWDSFTIRVDYSLPGNTEEPLLEELDITGIVPTVVVSNNVAPDTAALTLAGQTPSRAEVFIEPPTGGINIWKYIGLKLDGFPPTVDVSGGAVTREPTLGTLTISEDTPVRVVNDIPIPDKDALALSGKVPTVVISEIELPDEDALVLSGIAPTVVVGTVTESAIDTLVLDGKVPIVTVGEVELPATDALSLSGIAPTATIVNIREPSTVALTIDEKTPIRSVSQLREPDTDALTLSGIAPTVIHDRLSDVPIGSLTIDEQQANRTVGITRTPDTDALALSGIVPTIQHNRLADVPLGTLTLDEKTPIVGSGDFITTDQGTLSLSGSAPTVVVANNIEPPLDALVLAGKVPITGIGDTIESPTDALALSGIVPTTTVNSTVLPTTDALVLDGKQARINDVNVEIPTGTVNIWQYVGLKLDGYPPTIAFEGTVLPGSDNLVISGIAPTTNISITPALGSLSLSGKTPTLEQTGIVNVPTGGLNVYKYIGLKLDGQPVSVKGAIQPLRRILTLTGQPLTANYEQSPDTSLGTLALSGIAPTVTITGSPEANTATLTLASDAPQVSIDSLVILEDTLVLAGQTLESVGYNPVDPLNVSVTLSGNAPTIEIVDVSQTVTPGTASLILESRLVVIEPATATLTLTGQSVSIAYQDGVLIQNPNATTAVPSNYEQCDFTGFRQLPGSLKLTWNKHAVRKKSWEERHPQDTLQSVPERQKGSKRPEQDDTFIDDLYPNGVDADDL